MLPGLRLVLAAIAAAILIVVLGFGQLVKLQVAQSHSASLAPVEARFAGLAFAERANWTPASPARERSLEALAPFATIAPAQPRPDNDAADGPAPARSAALAVPEPEPPQQPSAAEPAQPLAAQPAPLTVANIASVIDLDSLANAAEPAPAAENAADGNPKPADGPTIDLAALPPPPTEVAPAAAPPEPDQRDVIAIPVEVAPAPAAPATVAPQESEKVASVATDVTADNAEATAASVAALPGEAVRLPVPRPNTAATPQRQSQPRPAKKAARKRAPPAKQPQPQAGDARNNPLATLFGGSRNAGNASN